MSSQEASIIPSEIDDNVNISLEDLIGDLYSSEPDLLKKVSHVLQENNIKLSFEEKNRKIMRDLGIPEDVIDSIDFRAIDLQLKEPREFFKSLSKGILTPDFLLIASKEEKELIEESIDHIDWYKKTSFLFALIVILKNDLSNIELELKVNSERAKRESLKLRDELKELKEEVIELKKMKIEFESFKMKMQNDLISDFSEPSQDTHPNTKKTPFAY